MKKYILALFLLATPIAAFAQSQTYAYQLDVQNTIYKLQSNGYRIISVRLTNPGANTADGIWVITYE